MLALPVFNTFVDWVLGRVVAQSHYEGYISNTSGTDHIFADDGVVLAKSLEVLMMALNCARR